MRPHWNTLLHRDGDALITDGAAVPYRELARAAAAVRDGLTGKGLGPGHRVALLAERTPAGVAALLGILSSGCCVVPLDARAPAARLRRLLQRTAAAAVVAEGHGLRRVRGLLRRDVPLPRCLAINGVTPAAVSEVHPGTVAGRPVDRDAAYVMFTSGSTGEPKGVVVSRRTLAHVLDWFGRRFEVSGEDRVLALAPLHFDIALVELLLPLTRGASACLAPPLAGASPPSLAAFLNQAKVTLAYVVGSVARGLGGVAADAPSPHLTRLVLSGEPAMPAWVAELHRSFPNAELFNLYGATEFPVATLYAIPRVASAGAGDRAAPSIPVGAPVEGVKVRLVDPGWEPAQPIEQAGARLDGEIWIGGATVPLGHLDAPELDDQRLVMADGQRWLRTGDLGRLAPDGDLHFAGRRDDMVKVRGHRVDLLEVDVALASCPGVRSAAAVALPHPTDGHRLVAAACADPEVTAMDVLAHCGAELPAVAVPHHVALGCQLPTTATGKVDRRALAALLAAELVEG